MKKCNVCGQTFSNNLIACPNCGGTDLVDLGSQATVNQPMNGQNMPMAYAIFIIVILWIGCIVNIVNIVNDFRVMYLILGIFEGLTAFLLMLKMKVGRIMVLIYSVLEAIGGGLILLMGLLYHVGYSALKYDYDAMVGAIYATLGSSLGIIFIVMGAAILAYGICTFVYFKKRKGMYLK